MLRQSLKAQQARKDAMAAAMQERRDQAYARMGAYRVEKRPASGNHVATPVSLPKVAVPSFKSQTLRDLARGQPCYLRAPVCTGGGDDRVVLMHGDRVKFGNCQGGKGSDFFAIPSCPECHHWYGHGRQQKVETMEEQFIDGVHRWWCWLLETGHVRIGKPR